MLRRFCNILRVWLGDLATLMGCWGVLLFVASLPLSYFATHLLPTPDPISEDAASRSFWEFVFTRLFPLLVVSILSLAYGYYESLKASKRNPTDSQLSCWRCWASSSWKK